MEQYQPTNCDFYDVLEELATLRKHSNITFRSENGGTTILKGRITDLYTRDKVEFLKLDNGLEIRLDALIEVDGKRASHYC